MKLPRTKLYISFSDLLKAYFKILLGIDLTKGEKVKKFENLLEAYWQRKKCFTLSTCRLALYYVLKSLKLSKDELEDLLSSIENNMVDKNTSIVKMYTIHSYKGLEDNIIRIYNDIFLEV